MSSRPTPSVLTTCPKCKGSGKYRACSPYTGRVCFTGTCFECDGTGKVTRASLAHSKGAKLVMAGLNYTSQWIVLEAAAGGNMERAHFYLDRMVDDMFIVGTNNARNVLRTLAAGKWYDDTEGTSGTVDQDTARGLRDRLISLGRDKVSLAA